MESMLEDSEKQKQEKEKQDDKIEKHDKKQDKKQDRSKMKKNKFPTEESLTDDKGLYDGRRDY